MRALSADFPSPASAGAGFGASVEPFRTRFAPSPNGPLHLGHAYAAIVAHDAARASGGAFGVRIEDIDVARCPPALVPARVAAILADLAWLGLDHDGPVVIQSQRHSDHRAALARLKALGVVYPCVCHRADIARAATQAGLDGPIYPGTCRGRAVTGAITAWRLDIAAALASVGASPQAPLVWEDALAGPQVADPAALGDVVLWREGEDAPAYHLAVTLDDAADGITLVTRGADLFAATPIHRLLQALLGLPMPRWHHHGLLVEAVRDGKGGEGWRKLAKRRGAPALADRARAGENGRALAAALRAGVFPPGISLAHGAGVGAGVRLGDGVDAWA